MPIAISHFSMVGFPLDTSDGQAFGASIDKFVRICEPVTLQGSDDLCMIKDKSGGKLWIGLRKNADGKVDLISVDPAFDGSGRANVEIEGDASDPEEVPFEVTISARFGDDEVPLVFDLADARQAALLKPGTKAVIDIAAFTYHPDVYADEAAYDRAQNKPDVKVKFATNFFIPSGSLFESIGGVMKDDAKRPVAYADFACTVVKAELRSNTIGGAQFWCATVKTYGDATMDVVMDSGSVAQEPKAGSIIGGRFWLSARVVSPP